MYISLELLWKIGYILISLIHIIIYLIIFVKLHKLNVKPDVLTGITDKLKTLASGLFKAVGGDLTGVLDKINQIKTKPIKAEEEEKNGNDAG